MYVSAHSKQDLKQNADAPTGTKNRENKFRLKITGLNLIFETIFRKELTVKVIMVRRQEL